MGSAVRASAVLAIAMVWGLSAAQDTGVRRLTLDEAIRLALSKQPDLIGAQAQTNAARQQLKQAQAAYMPSVTAEYSYQDSFQYNSAGTGLGTNTVSSSGHQADVVLSYKLLDSGTRDATRSQAKASLQATSYSQESQRQTVIVDVASTYYDALMQDALVRVADANVKRYQATRDLVEAQVENKVAARKDTYQAEADLASAKVSLLNAQNNALLARTQFRQAIGLETDEEIAPTEVPETYSGSAPLASLESYRQQAYAQRPDLLQAVKTVEQRKAGVRLAQANNSFSLSVDGSLTGAAIPNWGNQRVVGITASMPLFDGGSSRAAIQEAKEYLKAAEASLASTKLSVSVDVEQAYRNVQKYRATVPAAYSAQQAAQVAYDAAVASRQENVGTVIDVLTAQASLVQAQINYVQAIYDLYTAEAKLKKALGLADQILIGGQS